MTQAKIILDFLKDLAANNNREWFAENKQRYTEAAEALNGIVDRLIAGLGLFDDAIKYLHAKDCMRTNCDPGVGCPGRKGLKHSREAQGVCSEKRCEVH